MTPIDAAIHARPAPPPASIVWVHRPERGTWCVLRRATGGRIITLCCDWLDGSTRVNILTSALSQPDHLRPHNSCPACETELAAGTPGAAVAVEPTVRAAEELFGTEPIRGSYLETYPDSETGELLVRRVDPLPTVPRTVTPRERPQAADVDEWDDAPGPDSAAICAVLEHGDLLGDGEA